MDTVRFLKAVQTGDQGVVDSLLSEEALRLHAVAFHITGDTLLAEETIRKAFLQIREGQSPPEEDNTRAWITRLAARIAMEAVRERGELPPEARAEAPVPDAPEGAHPQGTLPPEEAQAVSEGLQALPVDVRAAIWLHLVEGDGLDEVAAALGSDRATVSRKVRGGLDDLRLSVEGRGFALNTMPLRRLLRQLPVPAPSQEFLAELVGPGFKPPEPRRPEIQPEPSPPAPEAEVAPPSEDAPPAAPPSPPRFSRRRLATAGALLALTVLGSLSLWLSGAFALRKSGSPHTAAGGTAGGPEVPAGETSAEPPRAALVDTIEGRVLDGKGQPVQGVQVMAYRDFPRVNAREILDRWGFVDLLKANSRGWPMLASTRTSQGGQFSLSVAGPPNLLLQALSMDARSGRGGMARTRSGDAGKVEIVLSPWREITGVVRDQRGPLEGAQVLAIPDPTPSAGREFTGNDFLRFLDLVVPAAALTDRAGAFRIFHPAGGERKGLLLVALRDGYATGCAPWNPPPKENTLGLLPAVPISGQVLGSGDVPASGARILALKRGGAEAGWFAAAISDEEGRFSFQGSTGGEFQLFVKVAGRPGPEKALWRPGDPLPLRLEFGGGSAIHGQVRLARTGQPVEGVRILCRDLEGGLITSQTASDGQGRYRLRGLPENSLYDLLVLIPGFVSREQLKPPQGKADAEINIELVPTATLHGRVTRVEGPVEGAPVEVLVVGDSDPAGVQLRWRKQLLGQLHAQTGREGSFTIEDVDIRGQVFVWTYDHQGESWAGPIRFSGADRPAAEVNLKIAATNFEVVVNDSKGAPLYDADVELTAKLFADRLPPKMKLLQWFTQRTSLDVSWFSQQLNLTPGYRRCQHREDSRCVWTDLMVDSYLVSVTRELSGTDLPLFYRNSQVLMGFLEKPVAGGKPSTLKVTFGQNQRLAGRVQGADGKGLVGLRIKVGYGLKLPGLLQAQGYTVTHSGEDGLFEAEGLGPGPYRVAAGDEGDNLVELNNVPGAGKELKIVWNPGGNAGSSR